MIPDYQSIMLPLLKLAQDEKEHSMIETVENLGVFYKLSQDEFNEWLPSKKQRIFQNRVNWAKAYLKMAGLVENTKRSHFKITQRGLETLREQPEIINHKYLRKFPEFNILRESWKKGSSPKDEDMSQPVEIPDSKTPEELIESGYQNIRQSLEQELLSKLKTIHPSFFEKIVVELLVKMGYGGSIAEAGKATRYTNDEGIDGIIKEDKLGLDVIYIQAKRWEGSVGRPEIQKFVGALAGQRAKKGVFITTSNFSKDAVAYATQMDVKIILIDGEDLAQYMIDYNLGVSVQSTYEIKKIDSDYFEEE
ncbi:MAG TPA: restriction endonuclease [Chitinophagaceae bacterium]|nr:restriction endonuclease [Chitinophagaceae bacterium]